MTTYIYTYYIFLHTNVIGGVRRTLLYVMELTRMFIVLTFIFLLFIAYITIIVTPKVGEY